MYNEETDDLYSLLDVIGVLLLRRVPQVSAQMA